MVAVKNSNMDPERLIKRFMKKVKKSGILEEYLSRRYFVKPSAKKRLAKKKLRADYLKKKRKEDST